MSDEFEPINQCQRCGNIQLLRDKKRCTECGSTEIVQEDLMLAMEKEDSIAQQWAAQSLEKREALSKQQQLLVASGTLELKQLQNREILYFTAAIVTLIAGILVLFISLSNAFSYPNLFAAYIGVGVGVLLLSIAGVNSIAWLFTSTIYLQTQATIKAMKQNKN